MKKIPLINATIQAANEKTRQAEAALGNAAADAREAKTKAEEAERIASNVQKVKTHSAPCCPVSPAETRPGLLCGWQSRPSGVTKESKEQSST